MRVLIAPDKFKGTLRASEAARAMARGAQRSSAGCSTIVVPLADGGEGTVQALLEALGGELVAARVHGPLGAPVDGGFALLGRGRAAVEMSSGAGLAQVPEGRLDALRASSRGAGELVSTALDRGARDVVVGVGGSASTDGGTGAARVLGWRFVDRRGGDLDPGGGALRSLARIDGDGVDERLGECSIVGACDVSNPLLGPAGAAHVFAPQKGASAREVDALEEGLGQLADRIRADLGIEVASAWGAGAGGGMGAGLLAFFGASLEPGFELVARVVGLDARVGQADLVLTGEGRLDAQSLGGKVPVGVAARARAHGVPCVAIAGDVLLDAHEARAAGFSATFSLVRAVGAQRAREHAAAALEEVAADAVERAAAHRLS
ncbi:MAG TPA: glycerate kinase [Actinomycetota bacterium]|nr:glycerate kinase [Actinomycetota bacterium]